MLPHDTWIAAAGLLVGTLYGLFGVGSAFATPVLSVLGVPGMAAVVGPLPALLPGSMAGAWSYSRTDKVDWGVARATLAGAVPATIVGSAMGHHLGGTVLLVASGIVLGAIGIRVLRPVNDDLARQELTASRRENLVLVVGAAAVVGLLAGLLANGGGFLLVPMFLLAFGLDMNEATGTSLVVATGLAVPTLITHAVVGDVDWMVSMSFAVGLIPGVIVGSRIAPRLPTARLQHAFGVMLVGFSVWFLGRMALPALF